MLIDAIKTHSPVGRNRGGLAEARSHMLTTEWSFLDADIFNVGVCLEYG
jgi:hypothetical protein